MPQCSPYLLCVRHTLPTLCTGLACSDLAAVRLNQCMVKHITLLRLNPMEYRNMLRYYIIVCRYMQMCKDKHRFCTREALLAGLFRKGVTHARVSSRWPVLHCLILASKHVLHPSKQPSKQPISGPGAL